MPNRYKKEDISKLSDRKIFFDANILIYLFWASFEKLKPKEFRKTSVGQKHYQILAI